VGTSSEANVKEDHLIENLMEKITHKGTRMGQDVEI